MQADKSGFAEAGYTGGMKTGRPPKKPRTAFGARIHELREAAGLTQKQVAVRLKVSQPSYAAWERDGVALTANRVQQLARIFKVTPADLFADRATATARRGGPTGRARRLFERISKLSRHQQNKILDVAEAMLSRRGSSR